ncbi:uncharacterized protein DUF3558 [Prauserella shujinwangii]|uniref:Uncharacterized protein DUF3558 n=1 Tax=Prauserella shujinwangii TaxID=1453103 RepID=A0A2T0M315_9PSEU|nr:DUF3558 family protein [Prauserella shujinwangii]PRX51134.1 uncharacterized protein DUF3558 [Prauserella shujinwangii]
MRGVRNRGGLLLACAVTLPLAACGATQVAGGQGERVAPAAASVRPAPSEPGGSPAPSSPPRATPVPLSALHPCDLLSPSERSRVGLTVPGTETTIGEARACDFTEPGAFGVTITVDERSGLGEAAPERARRTWIGGHEAARVADEAADDGTCAVLLAVGVAASVQVDVSNAGFRGTEQACARADTVARLIEPDLP